ncbi:MAG: hypothetical protein LBD51_10025 [Bifidobacteriaceae bacterium]|nr:hypothetical protein [Bifidobacteriaceae bacterium]
MPDEGPGADTAWRNARYRTRTAAIAYDALAENTDLEMAEVWTLAEGVTVAGAGLAATHQVWDIAADYDQALRDARSPTWEAALTDPAGHLVRPDDAIGHSILRAWSWAATLIRNDVDSRQARYAANTLLLRAGFDWVLLPPGRLRQYRDSVAAIKRMGNPTRFYQMMLTPCDTAEGG